MNRFLNHDYQQNNNQIYNLYADIKLNIIAVTIII